MGGSSFFALAPGVLVVSFAENDEQAGMPVPWPLRA